jgi:hypothetical protein
MKHSSRALAAPFWAGDKNASDRFEPSFYLSINYSWHILLIFQVYHLLFPVTAEREGILSCPYFIRSILSHFLFCATFISEKTQTPVPLLRKPSLASDGKIKTGAEALPIGCSCSSGGFFGP